MKPAGQSDFALGAAEGGSEAGMDAMPEGETTSAATGIWLDPETLVACGDSRLPTSEVLSATGWPFACTDGVLANSLATQQLAGHRQAVSPDG